MKKILIVLTIGLAIGIPVGFALSKVFSGIPNSKDYSSVVSDLSDKTITGKQLSPFLQKTNTIQISRNIPSENDNFSFGNEADDSDALFIENDILKIKVGYSGGCKDHEFTLVSKGGFLESNPVQVETYLIHDGKGDACEGYINRTLEFDLTPLKDSYIKGYRSNKGIMIIHIHGSGAKKESIRYEF